MIQNKSLIKVLTSLLTAFTLFVNCISQLFTGGGSMDLSQVTADDYRHIVTVYTQMMIGTDNLDMADNNIKAKIDGIVGAGLYSRSKLVKDGTAPWVGGAGITGSPQISTVYANILNMARAYACRQGSVYHDEGLLSDIVYSLDWMYDNCYGKDVSILTEFGNWWDWEIGGPTNLVNSLVLVGDSIGRDSVDKYLYPVNYFVPAPERTSANLVDSAYIAIGAGALQNDGKKIYMARKKLDDVFKFVKNGDGFYKDGSYIMHDNIAYQGGYGTIMLEALSRVILSLHGTFFAISDKNISTQVSWAFDSFIPLMYKGSLPGMVRGRNIVRNTDDIGIGFAAVSGMLRMTQYACAESAGRLAGAIKYFYKENSSRYISSAGLFDLCLFNELMNDNTVKAWDNNIVTKVFPKMDRVSKISESYSVGISMASKRTAKYEAINNENGKGWYTGDGMLYVSCSPYDYNYDYWSNVNFYRLPGTTVTTRGRTEKNLLLKDLPATAFAGGVSLNDCAVASMRLLGSNTDFISTLTAKKAWFLFDDEIVSLGSDINCSDNYSAETIIENRRIDENTVFTADGNPVNGNCGVLNNAKSLYVSGFGGIYLLCSASVNYKKTGTAPDFLELWLDHGKDVKEATYAYAILPAKTSAETENYANNPDIEILANNRTVQAVRENKSDISGYVFHSRGNLGFVTVDKPCILMTRQTEKDFTVTVCDPTQALCSMKIKLQIPGLKLDVADENIKARVAGDAVELTVDCSDRSGLGSKAVFLIPR